MGGRSWQPLPAPRTSSAACFAVGIAPRGCRRSVRRRPALRPRRHAPRSDRPGALLSARKVLPAAQDGGDLVPPCRQRRQRFGRRRKFLLRRALRWPWRCRPGPDRGAGPRRHQRSSSRARARKAARSWPRRAKGCLSNASSGTGAKRASAASASRQRNAAGGGMRQRPAGGIVDRDVPARHFGRHAARQIAVRRHQRGGAARCFQRSRARPAR